MVGRRVLWSLLGFMVSAVLVSHAAAVTLNVNGPNGEAIPSYRWLVEEDDTFHIVPGLAIGKILSTSFHRSYMPVVTKGHATGPASITLDPAKYYFISVVPDSGYAIGGAPVVPGQTSATAVCNKYPLPTAQITVLVFGDNYPVNGTPDEPEEVGLPGFKVVLYEAGGKYGMSGGQVMQDFFGNPLGTVYDASGAVLSMGSGVFTSDANGNVTIKNLAQGKYTVFVVPPQGEGWHQTSTIEGTKGSDAWVKPNEPPYFAEFGPPGEHVFFGFVKETNDTTVLNGSHNITGQIVNLHNSRPPDYTFWPGEPIPAAWVGLNDLSQGRGKTVWVAPCNADSTFTIPHVAPGSYELVVWDENLDLITGFLQVTVANTDVNLGQVPIFNWFARMNNLVFNDLNENGFQDPGEPGIPEVRCNLRLRDGSKYFSNVTDSNGECNFEETFPFFNWLVAEVDHTRDKSTGVTVVVDGGGQVLPDQGWAYPSFGTLTPQAQFQPDGVTPLINPNTGNNLSRTQMGPVTVQAFQDFLGQTNVLQWGKSTYNLVDVDNAPKGNFPGPEDIDYNHNGVFDASNGGISGIVSYDVTRAEEDPRFGVDEPWQPGIPRVEVVLYADANEDTFIDDLNNNGHVDLADVDNYPFNWTHPAPGHPAQKGPEDVDYNGNNQFDYGDAMNVTWTTSWDDTPPTGAQGPPFTLHGVPTDCYDGLRNFNQVRPGVFDGYYEFKSPYPGLSEGLAEGTYIVQAVMPPGYEIVKEEDRNVLFGDTYQPAAFAPILQLPPLPVGADHVVPAELSLFPGKPCRLAGQTRRLADFRQVKLERGQNGICKFFMYTEVPIAGHILGIILDDLANEFDPASPAFGEKFSPPWLPISIRDWAGHEISRVYSDEFGAYNALVPSTFTIDPPFPSGVSPNMLTVVLNSPGPILDTNPASPTYNQMITDPFFNRQYSQFSYTLQYMAGQTTYLDTPVVRIAAFAGPNQFPLDCESPDGTPVIWSVVGPDGKGPYLPSLAGAPSTRTLTIASAGMVSVPNPLYDPAGTQPKTIMRNYGFGASQGTGSVTLGGIPLSITAWTDGAITAVVPSTAKTGQLLITKGNGKVTPVGITVTLGPISGTVRYVVPSSDPTAHPIQDAIDAANPNDLILIAPGRYDELVIMWKPVQLQGYGAASTIINAIKVPAEKTQAWRDKTEALLAQGKIDLTPGQEVGFGGIEPITLFDEEGAPVTVLALNAPASQGGFGASPNARIDGLGLTGGDESGGVIVNGYCHYLEISNNDIFNNQGFYNGGIRMGHSALTYEGPNGLVYDNCANDHVRIHHNHIDENGGLAGVGGGISLYTGCDYYEITDNAICGNFTVGNGGGIGHMGVSDHGLIARNEIVFNQSFYQGNPTTGGGIFVGGETPINAGGVSPGAGNVKIIGNKIQGNQGGAGDGGGIRLEMTNGEDIAASPNSPNPWYTIDILNNIIVNNVTGLAGGGIALQDAVKVNIIQDTIAYNDSTATAAEAFLPGSPNQSTPQVAGIAARAHSPALVSVFGNNASVLPYKVYSRPVLRNDIIYHNRSFYFFVNDLLNPPFGLLPLPSAPVFNDIAVLGTASPQKLNPLNSVLTSTTGYDASNTSADPLFVTPFYNGNRGQTLIQPETTTSIGVAPAFDEGGNFIDVHFGPLTLYDPATGKLVADYHISGTGSSAYNRGLTSALSSFPQLALDFDRNPRPTSTRTDAGADQYYSSNPVAAPVAENDNYLAMGGTIFVGASAGVLTNDTNTSSAPMTAVLAAAPLHGILVLNSDGSFSYTRSLLSFSGTDTFTYRANNGTNSNVATVSIVIPSSVGNFPPAPIATAITTFKNRMAVTRVIPNDPNPFDTFTYAITGGPSHGTASISQNGFLTYTPALDYIGPDSVTVTVTDQSLASGSTAVGITVSDMLSQTGPLRLQGGTGPNDVNLSIACGDGFIKMADGNVVYVFGFQDITGVTDQMGAMSHMLGAEIPAPTIRVKEGQHVYLNLTNIGMTIRPDLFDPHTVHFHGYANAASIFDGMPDGSIGVNMGATFTYYYNIHDAGTYLYHCHQEATEHMQMGMLGNFIVTPLQDGTDYEYPPASGKHFTKFAYDDADGSTGYDADYPVFISAMDPKFHDADANIQPVNFALMKDKYWLINGRGYPDTLNPLPLPGPDENHNQTSQPMNTVIDCKSGDRILLRLQNVSVSEFTTFSSPGIPLIVVGHDTRLLRSTGGQNQYYTTTTINLGGGSVYDVIMDTRGVPSGIYPLYTSNLQHLCNDGEDFGGCMTEVVVHAQ